MDKEVFTKAQKEAVHKLFAHYGKKGGAVTAKRGVEHYKKMREISGKVKERIANKTLKEEDQARCVEVMAEGGTFDSVAKEINMPVSYVQRIMRELSTE